MSRWSRSLAVVLCAAAVAAGGAASLAGQERPAKAETPALITSCGQSPGPTTIKVVMQRLKLAYELDPLATPETLQAKAKAGTPYKSLIVVMGASLYFSNFRYSHESFLRSLFVRQVALCYQLGCFFYTSIVIRKANKINPINHFGYSTAKALPYLKSTKSLFQKNYIEAF